MATLLDVSFLQKFSSLFIFLLVLFLSYAFLQKTEILGKHKNGLNAIVAFLIALLFSLSTTIVAIFRSFIPIVILLIIIVITIVIGFHALGVKEDDISDMIKRNGDLKWIIAVLIIVIFAAVVFNVNNRTTEFDRYGNIEEQNYSDRYDTANESELDVNYESGVFNPKILGLILIFLIGMFAVRLLAGDNMGKHE